MTEEDPIEEEVTNLYEWQSKLQLTVKYHPDDHQEFVKAFNELDDILDAKLEMEFKNNWPELKEKYDLEEKILE